jgi:4-phosphopantoate---beta-alanine ligase
MSEVPSTHPRSTSLKTREMIVAGVEKGITSIHGLIAHGRGEAFDYLIGEKTNSFAEEAIKAAAARLITAKHPVLSLNGNVTALAAKEMVQLGQCCNAPLEINIFHPSKEREVLMREYLLAAGAEQVLMPTQEAQLSFIDSNRKYVHPEGIFKADVIFVPLEDGDRCEALRKMGKDVITVDLNPLSRTALTASMTIVDNLLRVIPLLIREVEELKQVSCDTLQDIITHYDNKKVLKAAEEYIRRG